jgi:hypothetical protein
VVDTRPRRLEAGRAVSRSSTGWLGSAGYETEQVERREIIQCRFSITTSAASKRRSGEDLGEGLERLLPLRLEQVRGR